MLLLCKILLHLCVSFSRIIYVLYTSSSIVSIPIPAIILVFYALTVLIRPFVVCFVLLCNMSLKAVTKPEWVIVLRMIFAALFNVSSVSSFKITAAVFDSTYWPCFVQKVRPDVLAIDQLLNVIKYAVSIVNTTAFVRILRVVRSNIQSRFMRPAVQNLNYFRRNYVCRGLRQMIRNKRAYARLGKSIRYVPRYAVTMFTDALQQRSRTNWFETGSTHLDLLVRLFARPELNVSVKGILADPCCGVDENMAYVFSRYFPKVDKFVLSDYKQRVGSSVDMRKKVPSAELLHEVDWVITSPPYFKGISTSQIIYNILINARVGVALKVPMSVLSSRVERAKWWRGFTPNYSLVCDPISYSGHKNKTILPEVWIVWLKGVPTVGTVQFNEANLDP